MLETIESQIINDYLAGFGTNLFGQPMYRLVFTEDLTELRTGEYNEYYGDIFIRRTHGTVRVPKYNYLRETWIIEKWFDASRTIHPDLPESRNGDYSIIYAFHSGDGPLPLNLRVTQIVMHAQMNVERSRLRRQTDSLRRAEEKEKLAAQQDEELLNEDSVLVTQLHFGDAVLNAGFPDGENDNGTH